MKAIFSGVAATFLLALLPTTTFALVPGAHENTGNAVLHFGIIFAMFGMLLFAGKIGSFIERFGMPSAVGELAMGIVLSGIAFFSGWSFIGDAASNHIIGFIAAFGALLLIFSIGLESNLTQMKNVGMRAALVATLGDVVMFVLGAYLISPILFPNEPMITHLFFGGALVVGSLGITATILRGLGITRTRAAQTFYGASILEDVFVLVLLAVLSGMAIGDTMTAGTIGLIAAQSFGFLVAAVVIGRMFAKPISTLMGKIYSGIAMKLIFAVSFMLIFGFIAELAGLEPIIGAFAAGLVLDQVHFKSFADPEIVDDLKGLNIESEADQKKVDKLISKHRHMHVEDLIQKISLLFIPVFFVYTGMQVNFASLLQPELYLIAGIVSIFAILGKLVSGLVAKGSWKEKALVGMCMVPRGEVGLIFAATGQALGVLSDTLFSIILIVFVVTTFVSPPIIRRLATMVHPDKVARQESDEEATTSKPKEAHAH